ncbi:hypothetical protein PMAC_002405 [Pneumocystis sp. 'macacae']|nr:hypothetical protein PMAC_002405 [Pneumocystis sp. 'macacae']
MGTLIEIVSPERTVERYVEPSWTIAHLKERLELITGIPVEAQRLTLSGDTEVTDTTTTLDTLGLVHHAKLYVSDNRNEAMVNKPSELNNPSEDIEHFQLSDEAYAARPNTFSKWREAHFGEMDNKSAFFKTNRALQKIHQKGIYVGQKCMVHGTDQIRNGWVRFIGQVKGLPEGIWVGIEYDAPVGKNDGSFQGVRYFSANENYGSFLHPDRIEICPSSPINTSSDEEI